MYSGFDYNGHNYHGYRKPGARKILPYIAIIIITSIISSVTVGTIMYDKFLAELEQVRASAIDTANENSNNKALSADKNADDGSALTTGGLQHQEETQKDLYTSAGEAAGIEENDSTDAAGIEENDSTDIGRDIIGGSGERTAATDGITSAALPNGSTVTAIAKEAGPSIVGIRMTIPGTRYNYFGLTNDQVSEGSGIIINKDGYIMTNYHVVSGADTRKTNSSRTILEVFLPDGREAKAVFKGGDEKTDLAVIKIDLKDLPVAEIGDSSELEVGELAVAIGNPLGMEFAGSVTVGVISALNRTIEMNGRTLNLIQTDAAINEGNSGGALLNSQGQVIGINSAKIAASGVEGLGFAIPINDAWPIVDQLIKYGYVRGRPYIGISGREISSVYASYYGIAKGIYVTDVTAGSGAEKAGIRTGDVIVSMAGKTVETVRDLDAIKESCKPGDTVSVVVDRDGKKIRLSLTFGEEK